MPPPENAERACTRESGPARAQRSRRRLGTRLTTSFAVLGIVLLVSLSPIIASQSSPSRASLSSRTSAVGSGAQRISTSGTAVPSKLSYCGLLGPDPGTSADLPNYTQNVSILWYKMCVLPAFMQLINRSGNLYLAYTGGSNNSTYWASGNLSVESGGGPPIPSVQFGVFFSAPCTNVTGRVPVDCTYITAWIGNVSTNELRGPFTSEFLCRGCQFISPGLTGPPASPGFPYGLVLGFSLAGAFAVGVVVAARRRG
jgi:hypothetical protein